MAFTPDSRFIWVGCGSRGMIGAIKLTVPDLTFADTVEIVQSVSPGTRSESHNIYVRSAPLALHVVTYVQAGSSLAQRFGRVIDLTSKTDLLPSMPFPRDEAPLHGPSSNYLASDRVSLLVYRGILETGTIVTYDISTRGRVTLFAPLSEIGTSDPAMQPERGHWGLSNLIPIPDGRVIAALASQNRDGGLMIWDYRTGQRIQRIYGPGMPYITLSPDGTRVAGSFLEEIYVYSLKTDHRP